MSKDHHYQKVSEEVIEQLLPIKFKEVYSDRLGRMVFVLETWLEKEDFERHKKLFGYTDIGWTVKYPRQLIRALVREGVWDVPEDRGS